MALRCVLSRVKSSGNGRCKTKILPLLGTINTVNTNYNSWNSPFSSSSFGNRHWRSFSSSSPSAPASGGAEKFAKRHIGGGFITLTTPRNLERAKELAQFAVNEQNEKENAQLEFVRVVEASGLLVSGFRYDITLEAMDAGKLKNYRAVIWVKPWLKFVELLKWEQIPLENGITQGA